MTSSARNHVIVYLIYDVTITTSEHYHHKSLAKYLSVSRYLHIFFAVFYIYQVVCVTCCFFHIFSVVIINLAGVCGINRTFYRFRQHAEMYFPRGQSPFATFVKQDFFAKSFMDNINFRVSDIFSFVLYINFN